MKYTELFDRIVSILNEKKAGELRLDDSKLGILYIDSEQGVFTCKLAPEKKGKPGQISILTGGLSYIVHHNIQAPQNKNEFYQILPIQGQFLSARLISGEPKAQGYEESHEGGTFIATVDIAQELNPEMVEAIGDWIADYVTETPSLQQKMAHQSACELIKQYVELQNLALGGDIEAQIKAGAMHVDISTLAQMDENIKPYDEYIKPYGQTILNQYYEDSAKWLKVCAERGHAESQYLYGNYCFAAYMPRSQAVKWWRMAAEKSHADASYTMSMHNRMILPGDIDYDFDAPDYRDDAKPEEEPIWLMQAAKLGNKDALFDLAYRYIHWADYGHEHPWEQGAADISTGIGLLRKLAQDGHIESIRHLAKTHFTFEEAGAERLVLIDDCEMFDWRMKGAELGDIQCQLLLAQSYKSGLGTRTNHWLAENWYSHCARRGNMPALAKLLDMHLPNHAYDTQAIVKVWPAEGVLHASSAALVDLFKKADLNRLPEQPVARFKAYYDGLLEANGLSFEKDLQKVVPPEAWHETANGVKRGRLHPSEFDQGGKAKHMKARHRTMFNIACYFKVLIDQVFHHHHRHLHPRFEKLTSPFKLTTMTYSEEPSILLSVRYLRDDPNADCAFQEAIPVFEEHVKGLVREHFPELEPDQVWATVAGYLPKERPYFQ
jgi:TPR repeat protein